jgi:hypothetical protein
MPSVSLGCVRSLVLAAALAACGAEVVVEGADSGSFGGVGGAGGLGGAAGGGVCPASADTTANCHLYCTVYDSLGCPATASACESACLMSAPLTTNVDPRWPCCLACVLGALDQVKPQLSCSTSFVVEDQVNFVLTYPADQCAVCAPP